MNPQRNMNYCRVLGLMLAAVFCLGQVVLAQDEQEIPEPRDLSLETSDGVALKAHFYPGTKGKETIPVLMLHNWGDSSQSMLKMAAELQARYGYAVIVPDVRGHGDSDQTTTGEKIERDRWRAKDLGAVLADFEACKNFLISENNEGNLNVDMLSVVADGGNSILATSWALRDWSYAPLGSLKQGQDVKALILLNPKRSFKGLNGNDFYQNDLFTGRSGGVFPVLIGAERDRQREATNIFDRMMRGRKSLEIADKAIEKFRFQIEEQRRVIKSRKNGDRFVSQAIGEFVQRQVFERRHDYRWAERGKK